MGLKQCGTCSEMVDEAKAFCPGCGTAFVEEEKREQASQFDRLDNTVQLGHTMYNQMLSDMGLNISESAPPSQQSAEPAPPKVSPEPIQKAVPKVSPRRIETLSPVSQKRIEVIAPAAAAAAKPPVSKATEKPKAKSNTKWLILGGVVLILGFLLVIAAAIIFYIYWTQFR